MTTTIDEIEGLLARATPGPWVVGPEDAERPKSHPAVYSPHHPATKGGRVYENDTCVGFAGLAVSCYDYPRDVTEANYDLIVALRNAAPDLIAVVRACEDIQNGEWEMPLPSEWSRVAEALARLGVKP